MEKTEEKEEYDEDIEKEMFEHDEKEINKTFRKAKRLIEGIHFNKELVFDTECDSCHHVKPKLIKFTALVGLKSKNGILVDTWWHSYCPECLSKTIESKIETEDIAGYL